MYDPEAIYQDADIEQAEMEQIGNLIARRRREGVCTHQSAVGYLPTPFYPEQEGLKPGQLRCTEGCTCLFGNDEEWYDAMRAAVDA